MQAKLGDALYWTEEYQSTYSSNTLSKVQAEIHADGSENPIYGRELPRSVRRRFDRKG